MVKLAYRALLLALVVASSQALAQEKVREATEEKAVPEDAALGRMRDQLQREFDALLVAPQIYKARVERECARLPEAKLYPYALPALAYANLAIRKPETSGHARGQMVKLLDMLLPLVAKEVRPPDGDLLKLRDYQQHAAQIGMLNLVLGAFRLTGGDARYDALNDRLSAVLRDALQAADGRPIASYPGSTWRFDTIVALASLDLHDRVLGRNLAAPLATKHFAWIDEHGTDPATGLPRSGGAEKGLAGAPRGCELSFRLNLMTQFAPERARALYAKYVQSHWVDLGQVAGFAEWPPGMPAKQDADSGPVVMGIGLVATGMGVGTVQAMGDRERQERLTRQLSMIRPMVETLTAGGAAPQPDMASVAKWFQTGGIPVRSGYVTGMLYGDAALFYAATWVKYPDAPLPATPPAGDSPAPATPAVPAPGFR